MRAAAIACLLLACGAPAAPTTPTPSPAVTGESAPEPEAPTAAFELAITLGPTVTVRVTARGEGLDVWAASTDAPLPEASDARGPLTVTRDGATLRFDRALTPPLTLSHTIAPPPHFTEPLAIARTTHLDGRLLWLPVEADARALHVHVDTPDQEVVTTLGPGAEHSLEARPIDLHDATFAAGRVYDARFRERQSRDYVAAVGGRAFDLRWVGAEIALTRDGVSSFVGSVDPTEHPTLIVGRPSDPRAPPVTAARSGFGLRVFVREDVPWTAETRLPVAQVMARRYLGGVLRVVHDGADDAWFSFGLTRWVAQHVLSGLGTLSSHELARELTMLEGLVALGADGPGEAMARGALYAAALDARLSTRDAAPRRLQHLLFPLLRRVQDDPSPVPRAHFEAALREALGDDEVARFRAQVLGDDAIDIPRGTYGPCLRRARASHRHFALGFDEPPPHATEVEVHGLVAGSPAAEAGVTEGMRLRELRYTPGDADTPITATVIAEPPRALEWRAYDREARGQAWLRVPRVEEERCAD